VSLILFLFYSRFIQSQLDSTSFPSTPPISVLTVFDELFESIPELCKVYLFIWLFFELTIFKIIIRILLGIILFRGSLMLAAMILLLKKPENILRI
jgi:hypothetical protein